MGKSRSERRSSSGALFNLFAANTALGWRVIDQVTGTLAAQKLAAGKWREVFYEDESFAGYQVVSATTSGKKVPSREGSPPTITLAEVQMNAGLYGRSRTLGMPEWKRAIRHVIRKGPDGAKYDTGKIAEPEDAIERAIEKVKLWPFPANRIGTDDDGNPVYGDRGIRVYPKPPAH
jgi:hypothetical protein